MVEEFNTPDAPRFQTMDDVNRRCAGTSYRITNRKSDCRRFRETGEESIQAPHMKMLHLTGRLCVVRQALDVEEVTVGHVVGCRVSAERSTAQRKGRVQSCGDAHYAL